MLDAPDIVLCSKLCRHNPTDPRGKPETRFQEKDIRSLSVYVSILDFVFFPYLLMSIHYPSFLLALLRTLEFQLTTMTALFLLKEYSSYAFKLYDFSEEKFWQYLVCPLLCQVIRCFYGEGCLAEV